MAITKLKNGKYRSNFRINGRQIQRTHLRRKDAVEYIANRKASESNERESRKAKNFATLTMASLITLYTTEHFITTKSYKTNRSYLNGINRKWGEYVVSSVEPAVVRKWIYLLLKSGREIATVEKYFSYLKTVINYAVKNDVIPNNPIKELEFKKEFKAKTVRNFTISEEEFCKLEMLFEKEKWYLRVILVLLWNCGMRISEILNLKYSEINFAESIIVLNPEKVKEKAVRTIALDSFSLETLTTLKNKNSKKGVKSKEFVFGITGDKPYQYQSWYKNWKRITAGTFLEKMNTHDLRHCYVTNRTNEGHIETTIMAQTGHSTRSMFLRYNDTKKRDVQHMAGFNSDKKELIEDDVEKLVEKIKENGIPLGTLQAVIRDKNRVK